MPLVGLSKAAEMTGKATSTIHRAIIAGRLSCRKNEAGEREIDTAELNRVFPIINPEGKPRNIAPDVAGNDAQLIEIKAQLSIMSERVEFLKDKVEFLREAREDLKRERDDWKKQAERATLLLGAVQKAADPDTPAQPIQEQESAALEAPKGAFGRGFLGKKGIL